ncbi:MAG: acyltransferase [Oscillospiraceae bacterium]|nr:acyltransferase [Oscillospiraceae bacterium]
MGQRKLRSSGLELLRIICMILIILHHYSVHGRYDTFTLANLNGNVVLIQMLAMFGRPACSIFAIISGYFMVTSQNGHKRIILLLVEMTFYSWIILILVSVTGIIPVSFRSVIQAIFPVFWGNWYVVYYLLLSLLVPFINPFLRSLNKKVYLRLLVTFFILWSIIPTFTLNAWSFSSIDFFVIMYLTGAYIRLYGNDFAYPNKWNLWAALGSGGFMLLSVLVMDAAGAITGIDRFINAATYFKNYSCPLAVIFAIGIFMYFKNLTFHSAIINRIAASTLGIYLIHDNSMARKVIWEVIFPNVNYLNSPCLLLHIILKCIAIFVGCLVIDQLRLYTVDKLFQRWIDKKYPIWQIKQEQLYAGLRNKFHNAKIQIILIFHNKNLSFMRNQYEQSRRAVCRK